MVGRASIAWVDELWPTSGWTSAEKTEYRMYEMAGAMACKLMSGLLGEQVGRLADGCLTDKRMCRTDEQVSGIGLMNDLVVAWTC